MKTRSDGRRILPALALLAALIAGCGEPEDASVDDLLARLDSLVPVTGVVTAGGKPVEGVVVTFLSDGWGTAHGETDEEGRFTLTTASRPGALVGTYKVVLSLLVAENGRVLGLGSRSSLTPDPDMATAKELFPPSVSSLGETALTATVAPEGGTFPFEVDVQLPDLAPPPDAEAEDVEAEAEQPAPAVEE